MSFMFDPEKLQGHLCVYTVDSWKLVLTYDFCRLPAETDICAIFGGHLKT